MNKRQPVMADKRQNYYSDKSTNDAITIGKRSTTKRVYSYESGINE